MSEKWVQTWGQAHSAFSFFYYPSCKKTYRMVVRTDAVDLDVEGGQIVADGVDLSWFR